MLSNYLRLAVRSLCRRRGHAALHIVGLAIGLACCFLVLLYVEDERSFDRFHADADRVFRLGEERILQGNAVQMTSTGVDVAEALAAGVPAVEAIVQTAHDAGLVRLPEAREAIAEDAVLFATGPFFEVFSFPLLRGDVATALAAPGAVVLSETAARRHFGGVDPMGATLLLERQGFGVQEAEPLVLTVTGVVADPPGNSTIQFDLVVSGATEVEDFGGRRPRISGAAVTYVLTRSPEDRATLEEALPELIESHGHGFGTFSRALVDPLPSLHFAYQGGSGFAGRSRYLYLFSAVALVILLIACINYVNLATAYALQRAREVGVRKTVGARRGEIALQFLTETMLTATLAGLLAFALVVLTLPSLNALLGKAIALSLVDDLSLVAAMAAVTVLVGIGAGTFPALYLARFRPVTALKGERVHGRGGARLRQGLVVVQFAATVALLAATAVIYQQLRYAQTLDLGFDGDQVLTLDLSAPVLASQRDAIREVMAALPGVRATAFSSGVPGAFRMMTSASPAATQDDPADDVPLYFGDATPEFGDLYGMRLAAGQFYGESENGVVLNETAARRLGLMADDAATAIGQTVRLGGEVEVVGVLRDFHVSSLHHEVAPVALQPPGEHFNTLILSLRLDAADLPGALASVERAWRGITPHHPFTYTFVDETFAELYRADRRLGQLFGVVAGVAVLLACLGLLGLAAYAAERRTKEVGIRKVLGATVADVVGLLTRDFAVLVLVAFAVGAPLAWIAAERWLEDFAYRVELGPGPFVAVGLALLAVALLTVSAHAFRAATSDPVKSLRYE